MKAYPTPCPKALLLHKAVTCCGSRHSRRLRLPLTPPHFIGIIELDAMVPAHVHRPRAATAEGELPRRRLCTTELRDLDAAPAEQLPSR